MQARTLPRNEWRFVEGGIQGYSGAIPMREWNAGQMPLVEAISREGAMRILEGHACEDFRRYVIGMRGDIPSIMCLVGKMFHQCFNQYWVDYILKEEYPRYAELRRNEVDFVRAAVFTFHHELPEKIKHAVDFVLGELAEYRDGEKVLAPNQVELLTRVSRVRTRKNLGLSSRKETTSVEG